MTTEAHRTRIAVRALIFLAFILSTSQEFEGGRHGFNSILSSPQYQAHHDRRCTPLICLKSLRGGIGGSAPEQGDDDEILPDVSEGFNVDLVDEINALSARNIMKNVSQSVLDQKLSHPGRKTLKEYLQSVRLHDDGQDVVNGSDGSRRWQEASNEEDEHLEARSPSISPPSTDESEVEKQPRSPDVEPPLSIPDMSSTSLVKGSDTFQLPEYLLPQDERDKLEQERNVSRKIEGLKDEEGFFRPQTPEPLHAGNDPNSKSIVEGEGLMFPDLMPLSQQLQYYKKRLSEVDAQWEEFDKEHGYDRKRGSYYDSELDEIVHREDELAKYMNQIERGMKESSDDAEIQRNEKFKELEKEDEDAKLVVPRRTRQIVNHCHRYYNRLFGNSGFRVSDEPSDDWAFCVNSSETSSEEWGKLSDSVDEETKENQCYTAAFVVQLMIAGSISYSPCRFPKADTNLDSIDVALQLRALRDYGSSTILLRGTCPGSKLARWFQRMLYPRCPGLVGIWYNLTDVMSVSENDVVIPRTIEEEMSDNNHVKVLKLRNSSVTWNSLPLAVQTCVRNYVENMESFGMEQLKEPERIKDNLGFHAKLCSKQLKIEGGDHLWGDQTLSPAAIRMDGDQCCHIICEPGTRLLGQWMLGNYTSGTMKHATCLAGAQTVAVDGYGFCVCVSGGFWLFENSCFKIERNDSLRPNTEDLYDVLYAQLHGRQVPVASRAERSVGVLLRGNALVYFFRCEIFMGLRVEHEARLTTIECHILESTAEDDGVAFFNESQGHLERCLFSHHKRAVIGISNEAKVLVKMCEFYQNQEACIFHSNYPKPNGSISSIHEFWRSELRVYTNIIRDGKALWLGNELKIDLVDEKENFLNDRKSRAFIRKGCGLFTEEEVANENCSLKREAMNGLQGFPLFAPTVVNYLSTNFERTVEEFHKSAERSSSEWGDSEENVDAVPSVFNKANVTADEGNDESASLDENAGSRDVITRLLEKGKRMNGTGFDIARQLGIYDEENDPENNQEREMKQPEMTEDVKMIINKAYDKIEEIAGRESAEEF